MIARLMRPHRSVREAQARLDVDRAEIADLTERVDRSASTIHDRVHVENNISAAVRRTLRGMP